MTRSCRFLAIVVSIVGTFIYARNTHAAPIVLSNAVPTINLTGASPQSNIAWHPTFNQYYASQTGFPNSTAWVWDSSGNLIQSFSPMNVDVRSWNYNPNTAQLEMLGSSPAGLYTIGLDGSGLLTGSNVNTIPSVSIGNLSAYDSTRDQFYSRSTSNTVNIFNRATGAFSGSITLDLAPVGSPTLTHFWVGYDPVRDVLITADPANSRALVHAIDGSYIGASQLPNSPPSSYFMGYANGQLFVGGTSGFQIFEAALVPEPSTFTLLGIGCVALLGYRWRKRHTA